MLRYCTPVFAPAVDDFEVIFGLSSEPIDMGFNEGAAGSERCLSLGFTWARFVSAVLRVSEVSEAWGLLVVLKQALGNLLFC